MPSLTGLFKNLSSASRTWSKFGLSGWKKKNKTQRCGVILFIFPQRLGVSALKTAFPSIEIKLALNSPFSFF
jgi:hypothetical protein